MNHMIYFDNAATTFPKPECVSYEMYKCMHEYCGNPGRGTNDMAMRASEAVYNARSALKVFFNADKEENVILTYNATYALNTAIKCFLRRRTHVLISDLEHNAVYRPVVSETVNGNIRFDIFNTFDADPDAIIRDMIRKTRKDTSAIICTAASNVCNIRLPIERIGQYARERGLLFILDASQLAGHARIDMKKSNVSILCAPFHKGLYAAQGGGFLIVRDGVTPRRTLIEGGSGVNSREVRMPNDLPEMLEAGTVSTQNAAGLVKAIDFLSGTGMDNIEKYEADLSESMRRTLERYDDLTIHGDVCDGTVFSVTSRSRSVEDLASQLNERGIMVRGGLHCAPLAHKKLSTINTGTVRFSLGIFNTEKEIEYLDGVLSEILQ